MKIFCLGSSLALIGAQGSETSVNTINLERRYKQLMTQINFYDPDFDPRKYWGYGCNCFGLGDRPMSEGLNNIAVDELDESCKKYKECLKCATMEHGDECIPEFKSYRFLPEQGQIQCKNKAGTCERALCECDNLLARSHTIAAEQWDIQYHTFYGGWTYTEEACNHRPKSATQTKTLQKGCCNNAKKTTHYSLFSTNRQECCSNGEVANIGMC